MHPFPPTKSWGFTQHSPFYGVYPTNRRSVYLMQQRLKRHPFLGLFDAADGIVSTAHRELTTVPTQALFLMNNPFVHDCSTSLTRRWLATAPPTDGQIAELFVLALGRPPTTAEIAEAREFVTAYQATQATGVSTKTDTEARQAAWSAFVRSLLVRNEFLFVD
jgi:hypothetical protein